MDDFQPEIISDREAYTIKLMEFISPEQKFKILHQSSYLLVFFNNGNFIYLVVKNGSFMRELEYTDENTDTFFCQIFWFFAKIFHLFETCE